MNSFKIEELKPGTFFTNDVMVDKTFILLTNTIPLSEEMIKALTDWNFDQLYSNGTLSSSVVSSTSVSQTISEEELLTEETKQASDSLKKALETAEIESAEADADSKRLAVVTTVYNEYINYICSVYTRYATHKELKYDDLSSTVKDLCIFIKENRRYVLRIQPNQEARSKEFLVSHSMRSTVLAITIGMQLRLPLSNLVELGVACILHEIGMIHLPPQLYMTDRTLSLAEKKMIFTHPIISYNILQEYKFPLKICLAVIEHHEREDGTGYPRHRVGENISTYAKIISVACSFEAITAPRHYKEAQSSYEAMVEMLKNNRQQYDENVIKALLYCLSLFPIGVYVYLSDGKIAQVVDVNPENPKNPIVQLLSTKQNSEPETIQTSDNGIRIIRALTKEETEDVKKAQQSLG